MPRTNVGGLDMYYDVEGAGFPVVCISGLSLDHLAWGPQVPALTAAGYRCVLFDNRDAGQTSESGGAYSVRQMADDTVGLMDALGLASAHIVGMSMGGMIAQEIAIGHPSRVASLTLVCTAAAMEEGQRGIFRTWRALRPEAAADDFVQSLSPWLFTHRFYLDPEPMQAFLQMVRDNPFPQSAAAFQRQCDAVTGFNALDRLDAIAAPTHVIVGAEDILTPPRLSRTLAERIAGATLTELPAAGHVLQLETPEAFNPVLIRFLQAQSTSAPV